VDSSEFSSEELVDLKTTLNGATIGTAEVMSSNQTTTFLKNVIGDIANGVFVVSDTDPTMHCQITDFSSSYNANASSWTLTNILPEEYVYWRPYTLFDYENEKNTAKRSIKLVDNKIADAVADQLEKELNA
jgi:hypothetical protein